MRYALVLLVATEPHNTHAAGRRCALATCRLVWCACCRCKLGRCPVCFPTILRYAMEKGKPMAAQLKLYASFFQMEFVCEGCVECGRRQGVPEGKPPFVMPGGCGGGSHGAPAACVRARACGNALHNNCACADTRQLGPLSFCQHDRPHGGIAAAASATNICHTHPGPLPGFSHLRLLEDGTIVPASEAAGAVGAPPQQQQRQRPGRKELSLAAIKRAGCVDDDNSSDADDSGSMGERPCRDGGVGGGGSGGGLLPLLLQTQKLCGLAGWLSLRLRT